LNYMPERKEVQSENSGKAYPDQSSDVSHAGAGFQLLGKSIIQALPAGIVAFGPDLEIIEANPQAAKLIDLGDHVDHSLAQGTDNLRTPGLDWSEQLKSSISTGETRTFDSISYATNGKTRLLRITCAPLRGPNTAISLGGVVIIEDITEKVDIHIELAELERLATIGKLASKVAHELNNPMDGILRYINLALRIIEQENLEKPKEYLNQCRQGLMRMVQIVSELLEFSRSSGGQLEYAKIEQIIEDAAKTMDSRAEASHVQIRRDYASGIPQIRSGNLFQVFCNLIKNALDAMPDGGELRISTRLSSGSTAVVEFRDTGTGFAPEHAQVMFEPFFTTKERGKGTGLGLAICNDIIERYGGRITAENMPEGGSVFTVYLPVGRGGS